VGEFGTNRIHGIRDSRCASKVYPLLYFETKLVIFVLTGAKAENGYAVVSRREIR
jgi:hypothetical protein